MFVVFSSNLHFERENNSKMNPFDARNKRKQKIGEVIQKDSHVKMSREQNRYQDKITSGVWSIKKKKECEECG